MAHNCGPIELVVPLNKRYARMVRLVAGAMAQHCGFGIDRMDDVKLAAEEGFLIALGLAEEPDRSLTITLAHEGDKLRITMAGIEPGVESPAEAEELRCWRYGFFVLDSVTDQARLIGLDGKTALELVISRESGE